MSNQPKITYRSDTTGCSYQMMLHQSSFTIQVINFDDVVVDESQCYPFLMEWRPTVNKFFDVVTHHINNGRWG